ncbi:MAG: ATP-binding cassette domain-containing protein, partial [Pseudomonadota bacterium]
MLKLEDIGVDYGSVRVLQNVSVELAARALNVVIGPNGTGKSSLLKAVAGLVPSAGVVSFN